jgi:amino acid transporter
LIRYFFKLPERNVFLHIIVPILGVAVLAYPLWSSAQPNQAYPYNLVPIVVLVWLVIGIAVYFYFRVKSPEKLTALGAFLAEDTSAEALDSSDAR